MQISDICIPKLNINFGPLKEWFSSTKFDNKGIQNICVKVVVNITTNWYTASFISF